MRCKTFLVALLALAFQAQAAHVSESEAVLAARGWVADGSVLGVGMGSVVEASAVHHTTNGTAFYSVKMYGGGTVFLTSDTQMDPVVAFTGSAVDYSTLDPRSPLTALLNRDVSARRARLDSEPVVLRAKSASSSGAVATESVWAALIARGEALSGVGKRAFSATPRRVAPDDLRVDRLLESTWDQGDAGGGYHSSDALVCYSYFTPKDASGVIQPGKRENAVCGCVATAMSQIMFFHSYPEVATVPETPDTCWFGVAEITLPVSGEPYAWGEMEASPTRQSSDATRRAIGQLTADAGRSVGMHYTTDDSGSYTFKAAKAFQEVFNFGQAVYVDSDHAVGSLLDQDNISRIVFANLDAGYPVMFGISSTSGGGHEICADGYGFHDGDSFVHLNMGWSGAADIWYNLPDINTTYDGASSIFSVVDDMAYNIIPDGAGKGLLSGRALEEDGTPVEGASVKVFEAGTDTVVAQMTTPASGVWGLALPEGQYDVVIRDAAGLCCGEEAGIAVAAPAPTETTLNWRNPMQVIESTTFPVVTSKNAVGNSWGHDIVLENPSVRVGDGIYMSIDAAVAAAREIAVPGTPVLVEVLEATRIKSPVAIDFDCIIAATNALPDESPVVSKSSAKFVVKPGATLTFSNVVFSSVASTLVDVVDGGMLAIAGAVDFGASVGVPAVRTAAATGLRVFCGLEHGFMLDCAAATEPGAVFGYAYATDVGAYDAICASVSRIVNFADEDRELRGAVTGSSPLYPLKWYPQAVPVEDCIGYFVDADGKTNTAGRVDKLFDMYSKALADGRLGDERRIVILESDSLSRPLVVASDTSIVGDGVDIALGPTAGFTVTGGELSISGMAFSGYVGNALFMVNGDGASLALGPGVSFSDIEGTNMWSGAVTVLKGSASATGATFTNCCATGKYSPTRICNSNGGAFYLAEGTSLALEDVSITGCSAQNLGGAVYAAKGATVSLAGSMNISGNTIPRFDDDIFLVNSSGNRAMLTLSDVVTGSVGVRMSGPANGYGNTSGLLFAEAASAAIAHASAAAFFCDNNASVVAEPDDAAVALRWSDAPKGPQPWEGDPDEASARVEYKDGSEVYYLLVTEALEAVSGDATIYVQGWNGIDLTSDVTISHDITLASDLDAGFFWLYRAGDCSIKVVEGASLTLRDISVFGVPVDDYGDPTYDEELVLLMSKPLFDVCGGSLTLASPSDDTQYYTEIAFAIAGGVYTNPRTGRVYYLGTRNAGAVCVWKGGAFRMEEGAHIHDCANLCYSTADGTGRGGAVLVDDGEAVFAGGAIYNCMALTGGGVFVGNDGKLSVSGETWILDNYTLSFESDFFGDLHIVPGDVNNLVVHDLGKLTLAGKMTGKICYTEGLSGDKVVFGKVATGVSAADAQSSAHNFTHDVTGDVGMAVSGPDGRLLVWSDGVAANGVYVDDEGNEYSLVPGEPVEIDEPEAVALVYNGELQVGVEPGIGYSVVDGEAVDAGDYTATVTPKAGFEWSDGSTDAKTVDWSIAKAIYDMSGVSFDDMTVVYGGQDYELVVSGELPDGVTASYSNNRQKDVGVYTATVSFLGDEANYEDISDMEATLTILPVEEPAPPEPGPGPTPAQPLPVAFSAISEADGTWTLSVTTAVEKCWYSLYATNSLSGGFGIDGVDPVEVRQATADDVPTMIFTRPSSGSELFWKAIAEPEDAR